MAIGHTEANTFGHWSASARQRNAQHAWEPDKDSQKANLSSRSLAGTSSQMTLAHEIFDEPKTEEKPVTFQ
jgi:hypothetical protein